MSDLNDYRVIREHRGDRLYVEGDTRTGAAAELGHLVPKTLELIGPANAKAEKSPSNKAEGAAPANKAVTSPRRAKKK